MQLVNFVKKQTYKVFSVPKYLRSSRYFRDRYLWFHKRFPYTWLDDKFFLEFYFIKKLGYKLNLKNPSTINEKLNWMKLFDRNPEYTQISDKWLCRNYVSQRIGTTHLKPFLGIYDGVEDINWQDLPAKFVIKATHGSGWNIICEDKMTFDQAGAVKLIEQWLAQNYYQKVREWQYKDIKPRVIIEPLLQGDPDYGLVEYQIYCFGGIAKFVQVDIDCNNAHTRLFLTPDWHKTLFTIVRYPIYERDFPKPHNFDEALSIAENLTHGMPFCRVDMHLIDGKIIISEMTLQPAGGYMRFDPPDYDLQIGKMLQLRNTFLPLFWRVNEH